MNAHMQRNPGRVRTRPSCRPGPPKTLAPRLDCLLTIPSDPRIAITIPSDPQIAPACVDGSCCLAEVPWNSAEKSRCLDAWDPGGSAPDSMATLQTTSQMNVPPKSLFPSISSTPTEFVLRPDSSSENTGMESSLSASNEAAACEESVILPSQDDIGFCPEIIFGSWNLYEMNNLPLSPTRVATSAPLPSYLSTVKDTPAPSESQTTPVDHFSGFSDSLQNSLQVTSTFPASAPEKRCFPLKKKKKLLKRHPHRPQSSVSCLAEKVYLATASVELCRPPPRPVFLSTQPDSKRAQDFLTVLRLSRVQMTSKHPASICNSKDHAGNPDSTHLPRRKDLTASLRTSPEEEILTSTDWAASAEAWTGDPGASTNSTFQSLTAATIAAAIEAWNGDPDSTISKPPTAATRPIRTAAHIMALLEAWAGYPLPPVTSEVSIYFKSLTSLSGATRTATEMMASLEAWTGDPSSPISPNFFTSLTSLNSVVNTATKMMASFEAWTGDPLLFAMKVLLKRSHVAATTAAQMMASLEAWTGDPPHVRTCTQLLASVVAWDDDPLVRNATDFAASLEAWLSYPQKVLRQ